MMTRPYAGGPRGMLGMGVVSMLALALLALGCVFAATAGPRQALATRTRALQQTLGATSSLAQSIAVASTWSQVCGNLAQNNPGGPAEVNLTQTQLGEIGSQLRNDFNHGVIRLAPPGQDWASMTSSAHDVASALPTNGVPVRLEVGYREPFTSYTRLVAGQYPGTATYARPSSQGNGNPPLATVIQVVVSQRAGRQFGLHPGSKIEIAGPQVATSGNVSGITLDVTGIVAPREPESSFWQADPTVTTPDLVKPLKAPPFWVAEVLAGPGEINAVQTDFGPQGLNMQWELPLDLAAINGDQAGPLYDALNKLRGQTPALSLDVAPAASALTVTDGLLQPLSAFVSTAEAVDTLLRLLYVSLAVAGAVTLLLAARTVVMRRSAELTTRRARGASLTQIAGTVARGAAVACVPAAAIGVALGVLLVPGPAPAGGWWAPAGTAVVAICAPAAVAVWQQRLPRRGARGRQRGRGRTRLVVEATACAAAIAGVIVFRQQGAASAGAGGGAAGPGGGAGADLYTSAAPVLIAIPAVIVVLRLYPLLLRGLLRGSARRAGATAFVGLARAARTALTPVLPAFALVLALTVAAFAGMVRDAVTGGEVAASWQAAGADATVNVAGPLSGGEVITPAVVRAVAAVPGVTHAAAVWQGSWTAPNNQQITGVAVDPASYAALVSGTQTFPAVPAALLSAGSAGAAGTTGTAGTAGNPQPVLASPQAAADLGGHGTGTLTTQSGITPLNVRVAGLLSSTPGAPGAAAFVIVPVAAIHGQTGSAPLNELLLTGADIDSARLTAVIAKMLPGAVVTYRSDILNGLTQAPLQHGTFVLFELALVAAGLLGLAVMLLELALGAAERETTLARLAAMGLGEGQRARVVMLEVLPALLAAAIAAGACAYVLPRVVAPAIDLSVFTGSAASVTLAPDPASFTLPLAGLVVAAFLALGVEIRTDRRHGVAGSLRVGE
jgi:putative ABC transport system permease protein